MISALCKIHPEVEWEPIFDTLAGGPWLREQIQAGRPAAEIVADTVAAVNAFDVARPRLYTTLEERSRM